MKRSPRYRAASALALAAALAGPGALAQTQAAATIHFELRAPVGCSSWQDFAARVHKRGSRIALVPGAGSRRLLVEIRRVNSSFRGSIRVEEPDGVTRDRELTASSCREAVEALSLIAAVTLDPDAMLSEPEPTPEPAPAPAPAPPALRPQPRPERVPSEAPAQSAHEPEPYRFSLGLAAAVLVNHAPEPAWGGSASLGFEANPGRVLSPLLRLSVTHAQRRDIPRGPGRASFAFTLPTLDVCPVSVGKPWFALRPCAFGRWGWLVVWGDDVARSERHLRAYAEVGGALSVALKLSQQLEIIADVRAGRALARDEYGFDGQKFFTTPSLGFSTGFGVAGGFP